jgi:hypothetical protein
VVSSFARIERTCSPTFAGIGKPIPLYGLTAA